MAIKILRTRKDIETDDSIVTYQCDTEADAAALPTQNRVGAAVCAVGSEAIVLTPGTGRSSHRRLNSAGQWVDLPERTTGDSYTIDCGTPATR